MQRGGKTREGTPYQQYTMRLCNNQPNRAGGVIRGKDTTQLQKDTRRLVTMRQDATTRCREQTKCEGEGRGDAAHEMSQEEFDQLVAARSEATPAAGLGGGGVGTVGEHDGGTNDNVSIFDGECGAPNVSIDAMSEGDAEGV